MSEEHNTSKGPVNVITTTDFQKEIMEVMKKYTILDHPVVLVVFNEGHFELVSNLEEGDIPEFLIDVVTSKSERIGRMDIPPTKEH